MWNRFQVQGVVEVIDGEPRYVLCNAVEKHHADLLVVGSHGYGAIKRFSFSPAVYAFAARLKLMVAVSCLNSSFLQGIAWERERLLRPPRALLGDDSQAAQAQGMIAISSSSVGIVPFACPRTALYPCVITALFLWILRMFIEIYCRGWTIRGRG